MKALLTIVLLIAGSASAQAEWRTEDTVLTSTWLTITYIDYRQTLWMSNGGAWDRRIPVDTTYVPLRLKRQHHVQDRKMTYVETNYFLGEKPSPRDITMWFASTTLMELVLIVVLPSPIRMWFESGLVAGGWWLVSL